MKDPVQFIIFLYYYFSKSFYRQLFLCIFVWTVSWILSIVYLFPEQVYSYYNFVFVPSLLGYIQLFNENLVFFFLSYIILFFVYFFILFCIPAYKIFLIKTISLFFMLLFIIWVMCIFFFMNLFNSNNIIFFKKPILFLHYNIDFVGFVDSIAITFILLTTLLVLLCVIFSWNTIIYQSKEFYFFLFLIYFILITFFISNSLLYFFIFFEFILIPMFFLINFWGTRQRKIHAVYLFLFYTITGSICMMLAIFLIHKYTGTFVLLELSFSQYKLTLTQQKLLWLLFFVSLCVKVPVFPFHVWLPEAHVEAPTIGSVLLAGILLKLGTYGMIRILLILFPDATIFFKPLVYVLSLCGIIFISGVAILQTDLKKIIAYASIVHMSYILLGLFSLDASAVSASVFLMLSHGLVSAALFFLVGELYGRYKIRTIKYFRGLSLYMPTFSSLFFICILANVSFPGTSNFIGEFLILLNIFKFSAISCFISTLLIILGTVYSIWMFNKICFGINNFNSNLFFSDLSFCESFVVLVLVILVIIFGIFPNFFLNYLQDAIVCYLNIANDNSLSVYKLYLEYELNNLLTNVDLYGDNMDWKFRVHRYVFNIENRLFLDPMVYHEFYNKYMEICFDIYDWLFLINDMIFEQFFIFHDKCKFQISPVHQYKMGPLFAIWCLNYLKSEGILNIDLLFMDVIMDGFILGN